MWGGRGGCVVMLHVKEKKRKKGGRFRVRVLLNEKEYLFFIFLVVFYFGSFSFFCSHKFR